MVTTWFLKFLLAALLTSIGFFILVSFGRADHDELYQYKFPCEPREAPCWVTQLVSPTHTPGNAMDFDPMGACGPQGSLCAGQIPAVSEGTFVRYETQSTGCTGAGLGRLAVIDDIHGNQLKYAHLSAFGSLLPGQRVMQGDIVGIEGNTGHTGGCQYHLHLEGISTVPGFDGHALSSISAYAIYESTNSLVGNDNPSNAPAYAIRQIFKDFGNAFGPGGSSWGLFGWTDDVDTPPATPHAGCAPNSYCKLYVHGEPDPQSGPWGYAQDFLKHPEPIVYEGEPGTFGENSIMVGDWDMNSAYVVTPPFYLSWLWGDTMQTEESPMRGPIGLPLMHWVDGSSGQNCGIAGECCAPMSTGCLNYQRFSHGYIWEHYQTGVQAAVICPDVAGAPWPDYHVDLFNDILGVIAHYSLDGAPPYDPQFDINGDGIIDLFIDITGVISHHNQDCVPSP